MCLFLPLPLRRSLPSPSSSHEHGRASHSQLHKAGAAATAAAGAPGALGGACMGSYMERAWQHDPFAWNQLALQQPAHQAFQSLPVYMHLSVCVAHMNCACRATISGGSRTGEGSTDCCTFWCGSNPSTWGCPCSTSSQCVSWSRCSWRCVQASTPAPECARARD